MLRKILKIIARVLLGIFTVALLLLIYFNIPVRKSDKKANLGVTYSWRYAGEIGLDWKETYLAIMDDLGVKKIRLPAYWDSMEEKEGEYDFSKLDWELQEAEKRNVKVILAVGQKVPRWPECFIPDWAKENDQKRKAALIKFVAKTVERYKGNPAIEYWQVENEPFLRFGVCPAIDENLLDNEIAIVRSIEPEKKVVVTDSGELSLWLKAAKRADVFGTTMYREVVSQKVGAWKYPIGPRFFHFKRMLIRLLANQKNSMVIELQGEPWISGWTTNAPLSEQFVSMNEKKLLDNVEFAKKSDFDTVYIWGAEWWYWLKVKNNYSGLWDTAQRMFQENL